jgi:hypothetical protein
MRPIIVATLAALALGAGAAQAKLPAPTPEQQAKAAEAKTKASEAAKKESELLGKAQDRAADNYKKGKGRTVASAAPAPAKK